MWPSFPCSLRSGYQPGQQHCQISSEVCPSGQSICLQCHLWRGLPEGCPGLWEGPRKVRTCTRVCPRQAGNLTTFTSVLSSWAFICLGNCDFYIHWGWNGPLRVLIWQRYTSRQKVWGGFGCFGRNVGMYDAMEREKCKLPDLLPRTNDGRWTRFEAKPVMRLVFSL